MDEVSVVVPGGSNLSGADAWQIGASDLEEDGAGGGVGVLSLAFDGSDGGLWSGNFVPPPPRPIFIDEGATPDGLTTCDLCSWAWQNGNSLTLDAAMGASGEIGWVLTLVIVSVVSAVIGAVIMIILLHCKRAQIQNMRENGGRNNHSRCANRSGGLVRGGSTDDRRPRPPISTPDDKAISAIAPPTFPSAGNRARAGGNSHGMSNNGVWSWLSCRSSPVPSQLESPTTPAENHYTHMDQEALYAELDQESNVDSITSPAYQNSAYADPDAPSAPSSAYYSDLSVTTTTAPAPGDRAYEVVGLAILPSPPPAQAISAWQGENGNGNANGVDRRQPPARLAAISETISVPSDYV